MGDVMGPLSYPPWREGETLPPYPPSKSYPPPCESEVQGVLRTGRLWYALGDAGHPQWPSILGDEHHHPCGDDAVTRFARRATDFVLKKAFSGWAADFLIEFSIQW